MLDINMVVHFFRKKKKMKMKTKKKNHLTPYNAYEHAAHLHIYHIIRYEYNLSALND